MLRSSQTTLDVSNALLAPNSEILDSEVLHFENLFNRPPIAKLSKKIVARTELNSDDAKSISEMDIPELMALCKLFYKFKGNSSQTKLRATIYLPFAEKFERIGGQMAVEESYDYISRLLSENSMYHSLYLIVDRWHGSFGLKEFLESLYSLVSLCSQTTVCVMGPSTEELKEISGNDQKLRHVLELLKNAGIITIPGGDDLFIHKLASHLGFTISIGQHLPIYKRVGSSPDSRKLDIGEFVSELMVIAKTVNHIGYSSAWFPWLPSRVDGERLGEQGLSIVDLAKVFTISRMVLNRTHYIRAPLSILNPRTATLCLLFGANDLGFAAIDRNTKTALNIPLYSSVRSLLAVT